MTLGLLMPRSELRQWWSEGSSSEPGVRACGSNSVIHEGCNLGQTACPFLHLQHAESICLVKLLLELGDLTGI